MTVPEDQTEDQTEETSAEETSAEETSAEETSAEETPAEETPAEETPAEETSAEETSAEETPAEETPAEETPAEETPAEETPAEETPASGRHAAPTADQRKVWSLQAVLRTGLGEQWADRLKGETEDEVLADAKSLAEMISSGRGPLTPPKPVKTDVKPQTHKADPTAIGRRMFGF